MQGYPHLYVASASAGSEGRVTVTGEGLPDLETASPPQFDGPLGVWSPETLFSAAVADCFILTFRAIARASKFEWTSLECKAEGVLERPEKTTFFTTFNVHAILHAPAGAKVELAERLLEKAEALCLITASLKSEVVLTTEIHLD
jgi:organic hydroperoxide reductase OsmC/OhrA